MTDLTTISLQAGKLELLDLPADGRQTDPAIVLLHEGLGSVSLWRDFPYSLQAATGSRIVAFSRYGHGHSDPPPNPRTPDFMHQEALEILPELLRRLHIHTPVLVGHSDGASIALIHAAHHSVCGLVAIAPHVFVEHQSLTEIRRARQTYQQTELKARMARHHADPDAAFYGWNDVWLDPRFRSWDIRPLIEQIDSPMLLIQGERDQYGTLAQLDEIERAASAPVTRVQLDCQHAPQLERPGETLQAIVQFVSELPSAGTLPPPAVRTRR
jgi:pimeloyl-ACP methyl ester carboxylesterase